MNNVNVTNIVNLNNINTMSLGMYRKTTILNIISEYEYLTAKMILYLCPHIVETVRKYKDKLRKIQHTLLVLYKNKRLRRFKINTNEYVYYTEERKSKQWKHKFMRSRFMCDYKIKQFEYEYNFLFGIADAIYNKKGFWNFLEVDTGKQHNFISNTTKYNHYYKSKKWKINFKIFPDLVVYTTRPNFIKNILKQELNKDILYEVIPCYI